MAMFALGKDEKGRELVEILNPIGYYSDKKLAESYKAEPYVLAGDVYGRGNLAPRGGWTHFTGSAAWFYRCIAENYSGSLYLTDHKSVKEKTLRRKVFDTYKSSKSDSEEISSPEKRTK